MARMTKEQIEDRFNELIDDIVEAERDWSNCQGAFVVARREDYKAARQRALDAFLEIYIGA